MGKIWGKGDFFTKSPPFPMPLSPQKLGVEGREDNNKYMALHFRKGWRETTDKGRNSHKCAICCCMNNRKSATSYNGNKHRSVIRRSKNKLQIVILCIEIFNTYIKFADIISIFSLFSPPLVLNTLGKGVWGKTLFTEKVFSHIYYSQKNYFITTPLAMRYFT